VSLLEERLDPYETSLGVVSFSPALTLQYSMLGGIPASVCTLLPPPPSSSSGRVIYAVLGRSLIDNFAVSAVVKYDELSEMASEALLSWIIEMDKGFCDIAQPFLSVAALRRSRGCW
jgi:hypothetical protein